MAAAEPTISLRPVGDGDEAFLFEVFAATRGGALRAAGLDDKSVTGLLSLQFRARQAQYRSGYPEAQWALVLRDGQRIGYWCVARRDQAIVLVDVALLPAHSGAGVGGRLLKGLLAEADAARLPVLAHVEKTNPARRLYERLGFEAVGDDGVQLEIRRSPAPEA
jgi:GNAT superfamily N-acetyltransferase